MKVARLVAALVLLSTPVGCQSAPAASSAGAPAAEGNEPQQWIPVPVAPEDDGPPPPSIKVPPRSTPAPGMTPTSGDAPPPDDAWTWGALTSDIDDPELAPVCADRDAQKGTYAFSSPFAGDAPDTSLSITRDLTEHRYGDGVYRTEFSLRFRSPPQKIDDATHGRTRVETSWSINVHLFSAVSRPDAFTEGRPEEVDIGLGESAVDSCSEDGTVGGSGAVEDLPYEKGTVTLTKRTATGVAGTLDFGTVRLTFDAPFGESYFGEDGLCCLK